MTRSIGTGATQGRSESDLLRDLAWFCLHALAAEVVLGCVIGAVSLFGPDPGAWRPKAVGTVLALAAPFVAGAVVARIWSRSPRVWPARYCWVAGVLVLAAAAVWVSGVPTGPGMCQGCGGFEKVWRTFFVLRNGSGLLNGDGLLVGCWAPLATVGYSLGVMAGLRD